MKDLPITMMPEGWMEKTGGYAKDMTLRDYFAAKAMQVVLYQCDCFPDEDWRMGVALDSYKMADAMLKAGQ